MALGAAGQVLISCYEPTVSDCSVTCAGADECAAGQRCDRSGYCVSSDADSCSELSEMQPDGALLDAVPDDAASASMPDARHGNGHGNDPDADIDAGEDDPDEEP